MKIPWYSACLLLLFLFRTNGKKGCLDENDFRHCHGIFFKSGILKVTWSQLFSKFLYNRYEAHWKQHFERYPAVEYFPDMDQLTRSINIKTSVSIKQKSMTVLQKRSVAQKSKCALRRTSNLSRPRFTYFIGFFFSQT